MSFHISIPGQPVGKGRPRVVRNQGKVRAYTPKKTEDWTAYAVTLLLNNRQPEWPHTVPVSVAILAIGKRPKRLMRKKDPEHCIWRPTKPDADNVAKAVLDALVKAGVIRDDVQVCLLSVRSLYAEKDGSPSVEVSVRVLEAM